MVDLSAIHFYLYPYWIADFKGYFWYDKNDWRRLIMMMTSEWVEILDEVDELNAMIEASQLTKNLKI